MSNLFTPELPTGYGALDSDAFVDGMPLSAHLLRTEVMSTNRLAAKGQHLCCLPFGESFDIGEDTVNGLYMPVPLDWTQILPPIPIFKMPGSIRAQVRVRANISADGGAQTVLLQVTTTAAPFNPHVSPSSPNVLTMAGTGSITGYGSALDDPGIPISKTDFDLVRVYAKGLITGEAQGSATPNSADDGGFAVGTINANSLSVSDATWDTAITAAGTYVEFYDVNDQTIARRLITDVEDAGTRVVWSEPLSAQQRNLIRDARDDDPTGVWWAFFITPRMGMVSFAMASIARSE